VRHPRGSEFDRQRDAVQALTDVEHGFGVGGPVERKRRCDRTGAVREEGHRSGPRVAGPGRRHRTKVFTWHPQPFPAGGQDAHRGRPRQDHFHQPRDGIEDMFAIVEDEEPDTAH